MDLVSPLQVIMSVSIDIKAERQLRLRARLAQFVIRFHVSIDIKAERQLRRSHRHSCAIQVPRINRHQSRKAIETPKRSSKSCYCLSYVSIDIKAERQLRQLEEVGRCPRKRVVSIDIKAERQLRPSLEAYHNVVLSTKYQSTSKPKGN